MDLFILIPSYKDIFIVNNIIFRGLRVITDPKRSIILDMMYKSNGIK